MNDQTNQDIVTRAEAHLSQITPGEWSWENNSAIYGDVLWADNRKSDYVFRAVSSYAEQVIDIRPEDADFIAASPALVRELVEEVKRLRAESLFDTENAARILLEGAGGFFKSLPSISLLEYRKFEDE
jgi:hypothetical protein